MQDKLRTAQDLVDRAIGNVIVATYGNSSLARCVSLPGQAVEENPRDTPLTPHLCCGSSGGTILNIKATYKSKRLRMVTDVISQA